MCARLADQSLLPPTRGRRGAFQHENRSQRCPTGASQGYPVGIHTCVVTQALADHLPASAWDAGTTDPDRRRLFWHRPRKGQDDDECRKRSPQMRRQQDGCCRIGVLQSFDSCLPLDSANMAAPPVSGLTISFINSSKTAICGNRQFFWQWHAVCEILSRMPNSRSRAANWMHKTSGKETYDEPQRADQWFQRFEPVAPGS